jgi:hypothetical protein
MGTHLSIHIYIHNKLTTGDELRRSSPCHLACLLPALPSPSPCHPPHSNRQTTLRAGARRHGGAVPCRASLRGPCGRCGPSLLSLHHRHRRSTRVPPHEQLLVRLGVGGASLFVVVLPPRRSSLSLLLLVIIVIVVVPPAIHPTSSCS